MIPVILRGDTARGITLSPAPGYDYGGCTLEVEFNGARRAFDGLAAGEGVTLDLTEDETARMPTGTGRVYMRLRNAAGEVLSLPWAKVKVTDAPGEVRAAQITIDPVTLDVEDATAGDSLGAVKSKLNAVLAFLRGAAGCALLAAMPCMGAEVAPLYTTPNDMPGDAPLMTNAAEYVDAVVDAKADKDNVYTKEDVDSRYSALSSQIGDISNIANILSTTIDQHIRDTNNPHKVTAAQVGAYTTADVDAKVKNAVAKDAENVVTGSFSIKRTFQNHEQSLSFGENDPNGPSIVLNRLYSTAPDSFFSGSIALIPSSGEKTSLLSRIKEYSAASWDARQEVESIVSSAMMPTDPSFSNAVLAVGLNIDTNSVAVLNEIAETFGGFPLDAGETATTIGGLLAALAAAVAWLKNNKVQTLKLGDNSVETSANGGVAKLDDFFKKSNSLLTGTIDARLPYQLYPVTDETGMLKDRAINTTSLASVTVPDNFTDLLIRASVASSLSVTMPEAITTKYGDTFPGEAGEYLITITKTGASEAYVRTIKLEVANA